MEKTFSLRRPGPADAFLMWRTFRVPGFTDGLLYGGPVSLLFALRSVRKAGPLSFSVRVGGRPVGRVWIRPKDGGWTMGYWIRPASQGNGFAARAVRMALERAAGAGVTGIRAEAHLWNGASIRTLESGGFSRESADATHARYVWTATA